MAKIRLATLNISKCQTRPAGIPFAVPAMPEPPSPIPPGIPPAAPDTMRALSVLQTGRPPALAMTERPVPIPAPGEALLRVDAAGFCHHDLLVMAGALRRGVRHGVTLGHEIAATVISVSPPTSVSGDTPHRWQPGDRAVSLLTAACGHCPRCRAGSEHRCPHGAGIGHARDGGFAEYIALPVTALLPVPDSIPPPEAALLACPAGVALNGVNTAEIAAGEWVVVTGAGGGLGSHAVQLAAMRGARVIAVTTSPDKTPLLETLGATLVIELDAAADADTGAGADSDSDTSAGASLAAIVMAMTDDAGAAAVIDTVGPPLWPETLRCLGQYGRLSLLGDVSGASAPTPLAELIFRDLRLHGVSGVNRSALSETIALAAAGRLRPVVSHTLPLTAGGARAAWTLLAKRRPAGRIVLLPPPAAS